MFKRLALTLLALLTLTGSAMARDIVFATAATWPPMEFVGPDKEITGFAIDYMKAAAKKSYGRKGDKIVQMNYDAIEAGAKGLVEIPVPESWLNATTGAEAAPPMLA
jgi:ABC-type amino acid transport substrate-binding protein